MESIWQKNIEGPHFESPSGNKKTDVLIVGGGVTGILCAYFLKKEGVDATVVEAKRILGGTTKNTTAKITCHHGAIFDKMIARYGENTARLYLKAHTDAISEYCKMAKQIDCDLTKSNSYVYSLDDREKIEKEVKALQRLGAAAEFTKDTELPFSVAGAVRLEEQAKFDPLKFLYTIARDLTIFENTEIKEITGDGAVYARGRIRANKIIVTTHFPFINKHGFYFLKMYQHRSYVLGLKGAGRLSGMYIDESDGGLSFRSHKDILLLGGGGHRTGKKGGGYDELYKNAKQFYPDSEVYCRFAAQDCMTLDDIAYIGQYSRLTSNLYTATGFNKWGMSSAMVSAKLLRDLILERENEYVSVFSPQRSILHPRLLSNIGESIIGLLNPRTPRCTHLGCALKYNSREHTWDCPCHGSRFDDRGEVIDGPATKSIRPPKSK